MVALHFPLMVNGRTIGSFTAIRRAGGTEDDDLNTYEVEVRKRPPGPCAPDEVRSFILEHRYGDGAWELVRKALEHIE